MRRAGLLLGLAAVLLWAGAAGAEVVRIEALGAVPLDPDAPTHGAPRDAALERALNDAVWRVALDQLPGFDPSDELAQARLAQALGDEPRDYVNRFRILEDRGKRPALFSDAPGVESEYVVLVEVHVDRDRVAKRLRDAGLLATPSGERRHYRVRVVLEDVETYGTYQAVRTLLEEIGARSALPVEMERGRAVLVVDGTRPPDQLLAALVRAAPPDLSVVPLGADDESLRLRARFLGATPAAPEPGGRAAARGFDTDDPNRY